jgi:hypothetical protein
VHAAVQPGRCQPAQPASSKPGQTAVKAPSASANAGAQRTRVQNIKVLVERLTDRADMRALNRDWLSRDRIKVTADVPGSGTYGTVRCV